jgi:hypothetical protein
MEEFSMGPLVPRRFTMLDAMVLIGATALGLGRASEVWPQAWEVIRRFDLTHFQEDSFPGRNFHVKPRTSRRDSVGLLSRDVLRPFLGARRQRWTYRKSDGTRATPQEDMENWIDMRTNLRRFGGRAVGYAAAAEIYVLLFPFLLFWTIGLLALRLHRPRPEPGMLWRQPGWCACIAAVTGYVAGMAEEAVIEFECPTVVVPAAVLLAWLVLALIRRWSAEPSWIDRAGRCLGLAWVSMVPLFVVGFVLWNW